MKIRKKSKRPEPHIPFISLADIAWQIIIFFLLATTFAVTNALNLDIPAASGKQQAQSTQPPKMISVQASETKLLIDGKPVQMEELQAKIAELLKGKKNEQDRAVIMEGNNDLSFQRDADIMYAIQRAGGILVMQEESKGSSGEGSGNGGGKTQ